MPNPTDGTTSVFRHGDTPPERLWQIGDGVIGDRELTVHGAAIVSAEVVTSLGLTVVSDELPLRHAVISNWPPDAGLGKAQQMELAIQIASSAKFTPR